MLFIGGVLLLGIIIIVHELGHMLLGRMVGIKAEIFSLGYGKGIWKKKIGDTTYQITAFPFGGYVKFYGDDYYKDYEVNAGSQQSYAFFSKPPLVRIIPVLGGPLFNLLLGILIFFILGFFPKEIPPVIYLWEEMESSPARLAGLQTGDYVLRINGKPVSNFKQMQELVVLSGGYPLDFEVRRIENGEEKIITVKVYPEVDPAGRAHIGIRIPGERNIQVDFPFVDTVKYTIQKLTGIPFAISLPGLEYLNDGDIILEADGKKVHSSLELQRVLASLEADTVKLKVERTKYPILFPWIKEIKEIEVPFRKEYRLVLKNIRDRKYNITVDEFQILSYVPEHIRGLNYLRIEGIEVTSFQNIYEYLKTRPQGKTYRVFLNDSEYEAEIYAEKIGLIGFRPSSIIHKFEVEKEANFSGAITYALDNTIANIALYGRFFERLFDGRISFLENTMGPIGMFAMAGIVLEKDIRDYFELMASLSIALMIINLIPFPVVDGGHIVLFLIEAIRRKRLPVSFVENLHRFAFVILLALGLWIMFRDILFILGL